MFADAMPLCTSSIPASEPCACTCSTSRSCAGMSASSHSRPSMKPPTSELGMDLDLLGADDGPAALRLDAAHHGVRRRVAVAHAVAVRHLEEAVARRHRPELRPARRERRSAGRARARRTGSGRRSGRMMSLVPSQISSSFASRNHFCSERVADVAGAAERLHRGPRREHRRLGRRELRHRRLGRERLALRRRARPRAA